MYITIKQFIVNLFRKKKLKSIIKVVGSYANVESEVNTQLGRGNG